MITKSFMMFLEIFTVIKFSFILSHFIFQCVGLDLSGIQCMVLFIVPTVRGEHTVTQLRLLSVDHVQMGKPLSTQEVLAKIAMSVRLHHSE